MMGPIEWASAIAASREARISASDAVVMVPMMLPAVIDLIVVCEQLQALADAVDANNATPDNTAYHLGVLFSILPEMRAHSKVVDLVSVASPGDASVRVMRIPNPPPGQSS